MTATVQKWGNSLAVRLPKHLADEAKLGAGSHVEIQRTRQGLLLKPARKRPHYTLKQLLAQCKGKTPPPEVDWGRPEGSEAW